MRKIHMTAVMLLGMLSASCQTTVNRGDVDCIGFIPDSWRIPIASATPPARQESDKAEAKAWQAFGVEQTGQLVKANGRSADVLHIMGKCQDRHNKAKPRKKFLGIF